MFWFQLAKELGMSVKQAQAEISSPEFSEWMAFYSLDPFGEERDDLRAGIIASQITNMLSGKKSKRYTPSDFMLYHEKPEQSVEEMKEIFRAAKEAAKNGNHKRGAIRQDG